MAENVEEYANRIKDSYNGKTVFISGGTGFVGKVLIEKLLRSCDDVKIILLIRNKKGKHPKERIREIFAGPLFDKLKKERGSHVIDNAIAIEGDVMLPNLGINEEVRKMIIEEVDIIFHIAATIRFDECLKRAVILNVRGTKFMLDLAKECKKLLCFLYVSTAYCHLHERILYEKPYPPPADPHNVIKTIEWLNDDAINTVTPQVLGDIPNTYAFTKSLAEALVGEQKDNLPVCIVRPSVVVPIWKEPIPGWTDNINGPIGLLIGAGKGVIRTMYCKQESYSDYIPVDIFANATLCIVWFYIYENEGKSKWIFNVTSSSIFKITMKELIDIGRKVVYERIPLNGVAWYPGGSLHKYKTVHYICFFLFHVIPAILVDSLLLLIGYKPVLCRVQRRIWNGFKVFEYYANNQWDFDNQGAMNIRDNIMNPREKEVYKLDGDDLNYMDYFTECVHAARLYILKESDESLPAARRHMKVMWVVDKVCKTLFVGFILYYLYQKVLSPLMAFIF